MAPTRVGNQHAARSDDPHMSLRRRSAFPGRAAGRTRRRPRTAARDGARTAPLAGLALRTAVGALAIALAASATAPPVGADPARPTNYRSRILRVRPALPQGFELRVAGGDAFLSLHVPRGHTVVVPDYDAGPGGAPSPYLRFRADGVVQRNERSVAAVANQDRYGTSGRAPDPGIRPRWTTVASDGRYAWHDHRIHWMSPTAPTAVRADGRVDLGGPAGTWVLPLTVDGRATSVRGELLLLPAPSPVPWFGASAVLAAAVAALGVLAVRRRAAVPWALLDALQAALAVAATAVAWAQWRATPAGAGGRPIVAAVPAVAAVAGLSAALAPEAWRRARLPLTALASAALGGWAATRLAVLSHAVLPTTAAPGLDRAATACALGLALGCAGLLVWRPPNVTTPGPVDPDDHVSRPDP
jgi:hypothetical protein